MSKLETTVTTQVTLGAKTQAQVETLLATHAVLKAELDTVQELIDLGKAELQAVMEDAGADSLKIDGFSLSIVKGTTSTLDKKKLEVMYGLTKIQIANAHTIRPKKPYLSIRAAGEKDADA